MMNGKLTKAANGFNSYEISDVDQNYIFMLADILTKRFDFHLVNIPVVGLDGVYWDATKKNVKLTVGWDIWSGAFVMAYCSEGSEYVERIESCFNENLYCKVFIDFNNEPSRAHKLIEALINDITKNDCGLIETKYAELEVRNNDDFKTPKESRSKNPADAFLFWRYYIDIEPKQEVERSVYIAFISKLLLDLRSQEINAVAACSFEDELPKGDYYG